MYNWLAYSESRYGLSRLTRRILANGRQIISNILIYTNNSELLAGWRNLFICRQSGASYMLSLYNKKPVRKTNVYWILFLVKNIVVFSKTYWLMEYFPHIYKDHVKATGVRSMVCPAGIPDWLTNEHNHSYKGILH